jgi:hypothetical protein
MVLGAAEILGEDELDELLGYDDDEMGARRRGRRYRKPRISRAHRRPLMVRDKAPTKGRELALGFDSVANVAAAGTVAVNSNPQQVFAPERIAIPATLAPNFLVNSVTIATAIQFLNATGIHAEVFSTNALDVRMKMDTAQINSVVSLNITNLSAVALRFFAALIGPSVL